MKAQLKIQFESAHRYEGEFRGQYKEKSLKRKIIFCHSIIVVKQKIKTVSIKILLLLWLCFAPLGEHPFYVSVTEFNYQKDTKELEVSVKIFWDDLELALLEEMGEKVDFFSSDNRNSKDSLLSLYLEKHLTVFWDGNKVSLHYLGFELEEDVIWCYLEAGDLNLPLNVRILNSLLIPSFGGQQNIVNFYREKTSASLLLSRKKSVGDLNW